MEICPRIACEEGKRRRECEVENSFYYIVHSKLHEKFMILIRESS